MADDAIKSSNLIPMGPGRWDKEGVARYLETLAEKVRSGEIGHVAFVGVYQDRRVGSYIGKVPGMEAPFVMLGALEYLKLRVVREDIEE